MRILDTTMEDVITQPDTLKDKIIRRIDELSPEKLKEVDQFIDHLENHRNSKQKILSFSGAWKDLNEERKRIAYVPNFQETISSNNSSINDEVANLSHSNSLDISL